MSDCVDIRRKTLYNNNTCAKEKIIRSWVIFSFFVGNPLTKLPEDDKINLPQR